MPKAEGQAVKLSKTQEEVVFRLQLLSARIGAYMYRQPGGFWVTSAQIDTREVPAWWVTIQTIRAMVRLGMLERMNHTSEAWRDWYQLTAAGKAWPKLPEGKEN